MKKCTYCWEEIQDKAKKCRYCWEWTNWKEEVEEKNDEKKELNTNNIEKDELAQEKVIIKESMIIKNEKDQEDSKKIEEVFNNTEFNNEIEKNIWLKRLWFNLWLILLFFISVIIEIWEEWAWQWIYTLGLILLSVFRFKNLWRSWWYALWLLVPFYNIYLLLLLVFVKKNKAEKNNIFIWLISIYLLAILWTIFFIALQGYSEEARKSKEISQQDSNSQFNINNWLYIDNSNQIINEKIDYNTLKEINDDANLWFLTNKWNYVIVIEEKLDIETSETLKDETNINQNKLGLKSIILSMWWKNIESDINKIYWNIFYKFTYEVNIDGNTYYYYAIFWWEDLDFENIYIWWENKDKVKIDWDFLINNLKIYNYE